MQTTCHLLSISLLGCVISGVLDFCCGASAVRSQISSALPALSSGSYVRMAGDITLGGLFPMHEHRSGSGGRPDCGRIKQEKGIQRLEAMLWAVDEINRSQQLLPGIQIGVRILDTCSSGTYALDRVLDLVRINMDQSSGDDRAAQCASNESNRVEPVSGVVGAAFSDVSINVAKILRLFKIPQVSYASTSTELSDKSRFEYFLRVVPPDNLQAQAIVQILKQMSWLYVSTVAVRGDYGEKGITAFTRLANKEGICVAAAEVIERNASPANFDSTVQRLAAKPGAQVVIMFVDEDNIRKLLAAAARANATGRFQWMASDSWGAKSHPVRDQEEVAEGAITILPQQRLIPEFDAYFKSLRPWLNYDECDSTNQPSLAVGWGPQHQTARGTGVKSASAKGANIPNCRNVWFREYWAERFNCTFQPPDTRSPTVARCTGQESLSKYQQEGLVPFVVDAVYTFAHALHRMIEDSCGSIRLCDAITPAPAGEQLLQYLKNVSFIGKQDRQVRFDENGDATGFYNLYQFQKNRAKYQYMQIGEWIEGEAILNVTEMRWRHGSRQVPKSICSMPCPVGTIRNYQDACCWSCVKCLEGDRIDNDTCVECPMGYLPTDNFTACYRLLPEYIQWSSPWALIPVLFSCVGILATVFTASVFIVYNNTPIIKASGRELCYVLLGGLVVCYSVTFVVLAKPSAVSCGLSRIGLGLCLNICYSALLTKTNRISRIFNIGRKGIKRPSFTSPRSQLMLCAGLVSVQLLGMVVWLVLEPPTSREVYPSRRQAVLACGITSFTQLISLGYNMVLVVLCTWYAFKTRKIPANFNEAKYIGFTMYSICIVWLAFVPIYVTTQNDYRVQLASLCICINISATVTLLCIFTPKLYIVLFHPTKNTRPSSNATQSYTGGANMRFARSCVTQSVSGLTANTTATTPSNQLASCTSQSTSQQPIHVSVSSKQLPAIKSVTLTEHAEAEAEETQQRVGCSTGAVTIRDKSSAESCPPGEQVLAAVIQPKAEDIACEIEASVSDDKTSLSNGVLSAKSMLLLVSSIASTEQIAAPMGDRRKVS